MSSRQESHSSTYVCNHIIVELSENNIKMLTTYNVVINFGSEAAVQLQGRLKLEVT